MDWSAVNHDIATHKTPLFSDTIDTIILRCHALGSGIAWPLMRPASGGKEYACRVSCKQTFYTIGTDASFNKVQLGVQLRNAHPKDE